jgi:hypothetical protein
MKRTVARLAGMPSGPAYETGDDTIAIGDLVRVPGSGSGFIKDGEAGTVIALDSSYNGPCKRVTRATREASSRRRGPGRPAPARHQLSFLSN